MNDKLKELKARANSLPLSPGVYIMKDKNGKIIYIGKAKSLKNRVTQYFGSGSNHTEKVKRMVENVFEFEYILCDTEFEAFLLENSLIKQNQPKYNILLKDDKGYHYIKITNEKWKKIISAKQINDNSEYIGPYNSGSIVKQTIDEAHKIFKLPTCNRSFDKKSKPCLSFHIGLCDAPCRGDISLSKYLESVESAVNFIKNGSVGQEEIKSLQKKMEEAAEELDFEYAAKLRDRISSIKKVRERQKVITDIYENQDVIACAGADDKICIQILKFRNGHLSDQQHFIIEQSLTMRSALYYEFLQRLYSEKADIPPRIVLDSEVDDKEILEKWLGSIISKKVNIVVPKIGEQVKLIDMCKTNAAQILSEIIERSGRETSALSELGELLNIAPPKYIEAYDISNFSGSANVAAMVVFLNGRPLKSAYRRFKIKGFLGQDDYRSMAEIIDRRLIELKSSQDEAFRRCPDLILLDGAQGQINAVLPILKKHGVNIPVFGMVKDSKHRTRAIASNGGDIAIKTTRKVYSLITNIQDEVHRFAISFNRNTLKKDMFQSELCQIEGVGKGRAKALLSHFKTVSKIKSATVEELSKVAGINKVTAQNIFEYFN